MSFWLWLDYLYIHYPHYLKCMYNNSINICNAIYYIWCKLVGLQLPCNPKLWKQLRLWMSRHEREVKYVHLNTFFSLFVTEQRWVVTWKNWTVQEENQPIVSLYFILVPNYLHFLFSVWKRHTVGCGGELRMNIVWQLPAHGQLWSLVNWPSHMEQYHCVFESEAPRHNNNVPR